MMAFAITKNNAMKMKSVTMESVMLLPNVPTVKIVRYMNIAMMEFVSNGSNV